MTMMTMGKYRALCCVALVLMWSMIHTTTAETTSNLRSSSISRGKRRRGLLVSNTTITTARNHGDDTATATSTTSSPSTLMCRVVVVDTFLENSDGSFTSEEHLACVPLEEEDQDDDGITSITESDDILDLLGLPKDLLTANDDALQQGTLFVSITKAKIQDEAVGLVKDSVVTVIVDKELQQNHHNRQRLLAQHEHGDDNDNNTTLSILVVRILTNDAAPSATVRDLSRLLDPNRVNVKTQYEGCSFGKFQLTSASVGAVIEVTVNATIDEFANNKPGLLLTAARRQIERDYKVHKVSQMADKTLFCLPPGTGNWVASAGVGTWRAQFNSGWCTSLTATMHELGHLIGLKHSNQWNAKTNSIQEYDDRTGIMSYGHKSPVWPRKCFNGHKNRLLQWYHDGAISVNPVSAATSGQEPIEVHLAAFMHYDRILANNKATQPANVQVGPYYLQYNLAESFNVDTEEMKNQVTVTHGKWGASVLQAGLTVGGAPFTDASFDRRSKLALTIRVCGRIPATLGSTNSPDVMVVRIGMGEAACEQRTVISGGSLSLTGNDQAIVRDGGKKTTRNDQTGARTDSFAASEQGIVGRERAATTSLVLNVTAKSNEEMMIIEAPSDDVPTETPTDSPHLFPSDSPSQSPSATPASADSAAPSSGPSVGPTIFPSPGPSSIPSNLPSRVPSNEPTGWPSVAPSTLPSSIPSAVPSFLPTATPSGTPSVEPSAVPSTNPSTVPTAVPPSIPSSAPSETPSASPNAAPSNTPSGTPSMYPSREPSGVPSAIPSSLPSPIPSTTPTALPSNAPSETRTTAPIAESLALVTATVQSSSSAISQHDSSGGSRTPHHLLAAFSLGAVYLLL